jgi:hypothetical protein
LGSTCTALPRTRTVLFCDSSSTVTLPMLLSNVLFTASNSAEVAAVCAMGSESGGEGMFVVVAAI